MGCDGTCSVVDVDVGMFNFRGFWASVDTWGAFLFPQSTKPDKHPEEDQQGADDDTSGDPSDSASTQPVKDRWVKYRNTTDTEFYLTLKVVAPVVGYHEPCK